MNIFQKVTLKSLKENKTRTVITIIGIILSLSMFTAVTVSVSSFRNYMIEVTKIQEGNWHGCALISADDMDSIASDSLVESVSFLEHLGYAIAKDCVNPDKPYLFLGAMDENAIGTLPIHLTEGRLPENENELLLPAHLSYNGGVTYALGDTIRLDIGNRISENANGVPFILNQYTPYLYTAEELLEQGETEETISTQETESLVTHFSHTYTVVGFYSRFPFSIEPYTAPGYTALTLRNQDSNHTHHVTANDNVSYTAYIRFGNPQDTLPWLEQHYPETYNTNSELLRMYIASAESSYNIILFGLASVLIFIILFGSISLIYNAFSISVTERTKQFGLLASLGATKKQLTRSVLFEAFCLCIIGIPIGIISGVLGIGITFSFVGPSISKILWEDIAIPLHLHVSVWAIVAAILLGLCTVLISAYLPARRSVKLSPIDAIRMTGDIHIRPQRIRTSKLTYKLFGLSGMLASKNFKRNRKKYRATVFSLFVSVVLFISASSFCSYLMTATTNLLQGAHYDISYNKYNDDSEPMVSNQELMNELQALDSVDQMAWYQYEPYGIYFPKSAFSSDYLDLLSQVYPEQATGNKDGQIFLYANLLFVNDDAYSTYLESIGLTPAQYLNSRHPMAVAFDFYHFYMDEQGRQSSLHIMKHQNTAGILLQPSAPEGYRYGGYYTDENNMPTYCFYNHNDTEADTLELPASTCTVKTPLMIGAFPEDVPFFLGNLYGNDLILMYPTSAMNIILSEENSQLIKDDSSTFLFMASNHKQAAEDISHTLQELDLRSSGLFNLAESTAQERSLIMIITVFSYGFIILISLIALANVFNTISTNIQLRKREFAMLKSTGMTPKGFTIMMCFECLLYGIKGLLYGLPASILITYWIYLVITNGWEIRFYVPWYSLVIAIGSVFLVVGSTMLYSMHKIGKENIIDNLKRENI